MLACYVLFVCYFPFSINCTVYFDTFLISNVVADNTCNVGVDVYVWPHVVDRDAVKKKKEKTRVGHLLLTSEEQTCVCYHVFLPLSSS